MAERTIERNGFRKRLLAGAWVTFGVLSMPIAGASPGNALPSVPGWALRFADDFDGPAGGQPSREVWRVALGHKDPGGADNWGTGEVQAYTASAENLSLDGKGNLLITPQRNAAGEWTSARITSERDDFKAPEGGILHIEARIQLPNVSDGSALGYWPAFWALGSGFRKFNNWPQSGEIDILENVSGQSIVWGTLHCGTYFKGPCNEPQGISNRTDCNAYGCGPVFHVFAFEWDRSRKPEQMRWYYDGHPFHSVGQDQLPAATWDEMRSNTGFFLVLNVAVGGNFANSLAGGRTPVPTTEPGHPMIIDYVGVWTSAGRAQQPFPMLRPVESP